MKKRFFTLLFAFAAIFSTAQASNEVVICGVAITDELASQGNLVPMLNERENVTATGSITYNSTTQTLVLDNATIETSVADNIIRFWGGKTTIQLIGTNSLSTTSVNPPYAAVRIGSNDDVTITGDGQLSVDSQYWYAFHLFSGTLTVDNTTLIANGGGGGICHNGEKGGSLILKNANVKAKSIYRLQSIELTDCIIVEPEEAAVLYDDIFKSYYVGVNDDWAFDIVISPNSSGISPLNADENPDDDARYNLAGQRVGKNYKGIVVRNGEKSY